MEDSHFFLRIEAGQEFSFKDSIFVYWIALGKNDYCGGG